MVALKGLWIIKQHIKAKQRIKSTYHMLIGNMLTCNLFHYDIKVGNEFQHSTNVEHYINLIIIRKKNCNLITTTQVLVVSLA